MSLWLRTRYRDCGVEESECTHASSRFIMSGCEGMALDSDDNTQEFLHACPPCLFNRRQLQYRALRGKRNVAIEMPCLLRQLHTSTMRV